MFETIFIPMKLINSNGKVIKVNHPSLLIPTPGQPLPPPKLVKENKKKG